MMTFITDLIEWLSGIYQTTVDWLYQSAIDLASYCIELSIQYSYQSMIYSLQFATGVANNIIEDLGFNTLLNNYYSQLPSDVLAFSNYLALPEALNMLLSAVTLRFIMGKLSFL